MVAHAQVHLRNVLQKPLILHHIYGIQVFRRKKRAQKCWAVNLDKKTEQCVIYFVANGACQSLGSLLYVIQISIWVTFVNNLENIHN